MSDLELAHNDCGGVDCLPALSQLPCGRTCVPILTQHYKTRAQSGEKQVAARVPTSEMRFGEYQAQESLPSLAAVGSAEIESDSLN